jgi:O-antigen biosynthesis protein
MRLFPSPVQLHNLFFLSLLIFYFHQDITFVFCDERLMTSQQLHQLWNRINYQWDPWLELWSGLTICHQEQSLISEIPHPACLRRKCLLSWTSSSLIDLDLLRTASSSSPSSASEYQFRGSLLDCALPLGGQVISKASSTGTKEVSFIMTLGDDDQQASLAVLELFRTAHEAKSGEFIFLKRLGSPELPLTVRLIENLQLLFNADIKLLVQSSLDTSPTKSMKLNLNEAITSAHGDYIALLDDTILVTPSWLAVLLTTMKSPPFPVNIGMIGPLLVTLQGQVSEAGGIIYQDFKNFTTGSGADPKKLSNLQARVVDYLSSKCLVFKKSILMELSTQQQLFDSHYMTDHGRDVDLALTLTQRGFEIFLQPIAVAVYNPPALHQHTPLLPTNDLKYLQQKFPSSTATRYCQYRSFPTCSQALSVDKLHDITSFYRQSNRILVMDLIPPESDKDAGSIRLQEMFKILHALGYQITFQPNSTGRHARYALQLLYQGIQYIYPGTLRQLSKYLQKYSAKTELTSCPWDLIIACRRGVMDKQINHIKRLCPNTPLVFDTVDVHFIREQRAFAYELEQQKLLLATPPAVAQALVASKPSVTRTLAASSHRRSLESLSASSLPPLALVKDMKKEFVILSENTVREVLLMKLSNITYVVSSTEYDTLRTLLPDLDVRIVSNIYNPPDTLPVDDPTKRSGVLFVGSMCHPPNVDAIHFIADQILSPNHTFPSTDSGFLFQVVVSRSLECPQDAALNKLRHHPLVRVHYDVSNQFLEDLHATVKIVIAPVLVGAGVKGKINYALLHGVPVISTNVGAEGMYLKSYESFLLANNGQEFYEKILELDRDVSLWQTLRRGGLEVMKSHFSRKVAHEVIAQSFKDLGMKVQERSRWQCPIEMMTSACPSLIHSDQLSVAISPQDTKVSTQQPPNDKQEYFVLTTRYPLVRAWRADIMKLFNISLQY